MEILLPEKVAVMTLPNVAFFPQALLPLHIFEPRYRHMLRDILSTHRLFAVAGMDVAQAETRFEPPRRVATVGIVRACQKNDNGTSNLLLQGLARVEVLSIVREEPYRQVRIRALPSRQGAEPMENAKLRESVGRLIAIKQQLNGETAGDFTQFLKGVEDPETFVDIAAFNLCDDVDFKQRLLETLDVHHRLELFAARLRADIEAIKLRRKLQGRVADERIDLN